MLCTTCREEVGSRANFCSNCGQPAPEGGSAKTNQDDNAGNNGDRIKHAVLLEILSRTDQWDKVSYRESHAGAGLYPVNKHIRELRKTVRTIPPPPEGDTGSGYFRSLRSWWDADAPGYPGGIIQAARWLRQHRREGSFDIKATENKPHPFALLSRLSKFYEMEVRYDSFLNQQQWLLDGDNFVILLDPFHYVRVRASDDASIEQGVLDHEALKGVLDACANKNRAVILVWTSKGHQFHTSLKDLRADLQDWAKGHGNSRIGQCHCGNYGISVIGINEGRDAGELPDNVGWEQSWLGQYLKMTILFR
jgi:hypothetical protein